MNDHDLRKMNRKALLELLIALREENEQLKQRAELMEAQLRIRELRIEKSGTMAEAAMALNGVFESADRAAALYLENMKRCSEEQQQAGGRIIAEAEEKAKEIIEEAEKKAKEITGKAENIYSLTPEPLEKENDEISGNTK